MKIYLTHRVWLANLRCQWNGSGRHFEDDGDDVGDVVWDLLSLLYFCSALLVEWQDIRIGKTETRLPCLLGLD